MTAQLVELPVSSLLDIPTGLRRLADQLEAGAFGEALNIAWVIDSGNGAFELGLLGQAAEPGAQAYLLFGIAKRRIEEGCLT